MSHISSRHAVVLLFRFCVSTLKIRTHPTSGISRLFVSASLRLTRLSSRRSPYRVERGASRLKAKYFKQELTSSGKQVTIATLRNLAQEVQSSADAYRMESAYINGKLTKKRLEIEGLTDVQKAISYPVYEGWD